MTDIDAVILAGGQGSRMGRLGEQYAKAMLPIGNEPLILHHLRLLASLGVTRVWIVVGHRADDLASVVGDGSAYGVHACYVEQGVPRGSAYALGRVRPHIRGPRAGSARRLFLCAAERAAHGCPVGRRGFRDRVYP